MPTPSDAGCVTGAEERTVENQERMRLYEKTLRKRRSTTATKRTIEAEHIDPKSRASENEREDMRMEEGKKRNEKYNEGELGNEEEDEAVYELSDTEQEVGQREIKDASIDELLYFSETQSEGAITLSEEGSDPGTDNKDEEKENAKRHQGDDEEKFYEDGRGWRDEEENCSELDSDFSEFDSDEASNL